MSGLRRGGDVVVAHTHCSGNRSELARSEVCGCFYCLATYPPSDVVAWVDARDETGPGRTALCPRCDVDAVLGSASGLPVTDSSFLRRMHDRWFS
jgi:hypothetical protein